jgi:hypothetical protein
MERDKQYDYQRFADEVLTASAPHELSWIRWRDDRIGRTVAVIHGGEVGDPLAESNLQAIVRILGQWVGEVDEADVFEATVGRSGRTWLRTIAVRVYDDEGAFTAAWKAAVDEVLLPLEDYPLLDEEDFFEREYDAHVESLRWDYGDAVDIVVSAIHEHGRYGLEEYIGDHDEVLELVEHHLSQGLWQGEVVLDGLKHYIEQRKDALEIPTLAGLVG